MINKKEEFYFVDKKGNIFVGENVTNKKTPETKEIRFTDCKCNEKELKNKKIKKIDIHKFVSLLYNTEYFEEGSKSSLKVTFVSKPENVKKSVKQIDTDTLEIIKVYKSMADAEKETGIPSNHISECCNGKRKSCGGFKWKLA
ncbi:MAG: hypothetical protein WCR79_01760 [Fusobacterium sp.]